MRIISQDKKRDVPYDSVMVYVSDVLPKQILVNFVQYKETYVMGKYNSEEDALYVMKCIRYNKGKGCEYFHMPSAEIVPVWRQEESEGGEV
jgi:hypothetical protein